MAGRDIATRIAQKIGLDDETVRTQIMPRLAAQKNEPSLQHLLVDIIGPGAETNAIVKDYAAMRQAATRAAMPPSRPEPVQNRSRAQQAQTDFEDRLPAQHKQALAEIDHQIASLTFSLGSSEEGPSKRQMKKQKTSACFCHARQHPLSPYTPLCPRCALPLCELQAPLLPCPSCQFAPLLASTARAAHLDRLTQGRKDFLEEVKEEMRRQPERFPELAPHRAAAGAPAKPAQTSYVTMSIGKGGAVTRTTHKPGVRKAAPAQAGAKADEQDEAPLDPKLRPAADPRDDSSPQIEAIGAVREGRPYASHLRENDIELYTPQARLDDTAAA